MFDEQGNWLDDPLAVVMTKPDFDGIGEIPKTEKKIPDMISHEQRIQKAITNFERVYCGLDYLTPDDVRDIIRRSFYYGRRAGFWECKNTIESAYKAKFKRKKDDDK